jgi:hypothetical protein
MPHAERVFPYALFLLSLISLAALGGCGLLVPEKNPLVNDNVPPGSPSPDGLYENTIVGHIRCEIRNGVIAAMAFPEVQWLKTWGATVTLKITVEEQSALNPGISLLNPLENSIKVFPVGGNVSTSQSFMLGMGGTGSANSTRLETIAYTYSFLELLSEGPPRQCNQTQNGVLIDSDLKIEQFIYDKAVIAATGEATSTDIKLPPYTTFSEDLTFVASLGGNITPTWKFAKISVDPTGTLLTSTRTNTNEVIITLAKVAKQPAKNSPAQLSQEGQAVHNAALIGSATGTAINSQAPGH